MAINWVDLNKKILNFTVPEKEEYIPYKDYDPKNINDPKHPENPKNNVRQIDVTDKKLEPIRNSLNNIFGIKKGSLPAEPEFGFNWDKYLFSQMDSMFTSTLKMDLQTTLERWEPRIYVTSIDIIMNYDYNEVIANVNFRIKGDSSGSIFEHRVAYGYGSEQ